MSYSKVIVATQFLTLLFIVSCCDINSCTKSCYDKNSHQSLTIQNNSSQYLPPEVPSVMSTNKEKLEYLAHNYWNKFNFSDTTTIDSKIAEKAFTAYLSVLASVAQDEANKCITELIKASSVDNLMFNHFIEISEKYLHNPNSPVRNEELYIPVLRYILSSSQITEINKVRPQYQLEMALKNRVGETATDFVITQKNGTQTKLSDIGGDFKLLIFNNPDCPDCNRVKELIITNEALFSVATTISVYIDSDIELWERSDYPEEWLNGYDKGEIINNKKLYDLKAIPTIYLLDKNNEIILKDVSIEAVANYLYTLK